MNSIPEQVFARLKTTNPADPSQRAYAGLRGEVILVSKSTFHPDGKNHAFLMFEGDEGKSLPKRVIDVHERQIEYLNPKGNPVFFNAMMTRSLLREIDNEHSVRSFQPIGRPEPHPWIKRIVSLGVGSLIPSENPAEIHYSPTSIGAVAYQDAQSNVGVAPSLPLPPSDPWTAMDHVHNEERTFGE